MVGGQQWLGYRKTSIVLSNQVLVLERQFQGLFESVIKNTSTCALKILNSNQRHPKFKKNVKKYRGCFSQIQQVNLKNKKCCTSPGYLSIDKRTN